VSGAVQTREGAGAQAAQLVRTFFRHAVRPALLRAVPMYAGLLLVGQLLLKVMPVHRVLAQDHLLVPLLAAAWALLLSYVRRPLFGDRQTEYLRSLPVPNAVVGATLLLALVCIDAPWVIVCLASGDAQVMLAGPLLSAAAHTALASGRGRPLLAAVGLLASVTVVPLWLVAPAALLFVGALAPRVWNLARTGRITWRLAPAVPLPWLGMTRALMTAAVFSTSQVLRRALVILAATVAVAALAVKNNDLQALSSVLTANLIVLGIGLPFLVARITVGIIDSGWALTWLCDATGTPRRTRTLGGLLVSLTVGAAAGALHGLAVAMLTVPALAWPVTLVEAAAGGALAVMALGLTATAAQDRTIDPGKQGSALMVAAIGIPIVVGNSLWAGLWLAGPAVAGAIALYHRRVVRAPVL
jgi:hypothetical protein